jgi:hypothetical protein
MNHDIPQSLGISDVVSHSDSHDHGLCLDSFLQAKRNDIIATHVIVFQLVD